MRCEDAAGAGGREMSRDAAVRPERAISEVLVQIARGQQPCVPTVLRGDSAGLLHAQHHIRLASLAHVLLRETEPVLARRLRSDHERAITLHPYTTVMLREIAEPVTDSPWVVFKGPVLSEL